MDDPTRAQAHPKYPTTHMCDGALLESFESTVRDSDVFVVTTAKCGQTWLQALLYHLKTKGGSPNFDGRGLMAVSPWLELPSDSPINRQPKDRQARLDELASLHDPRVLKMHVIWPEIPRPIGSAAKIITITRDPRDVAYSMFCHLRSMSSGGSSFAPENWDEYFEQWFERGSYFKFVQSFWPHRGDADVLWLCYEEMHRDVRGHAERLLDFLGWHVSPAEIDRAVELVAFDNMQRSEKTDIFTGRGGIWKEDSAFFRQGAVGENRKQLSREQERRIVERCIADLGQEASAYVLRLA